MTSAFTTSPSTDDASAEVDSVLLQVSLALPLINYWQLRQAEWEKLTMEPKLTNVVFKGKLPGQPWDHQRCNILPPLSPPNLWNIGLNLWDNLKTLVFIWGTIWNIGFHLWDNLKTHQQPFLPVLRQSSDRGRGDKQEGSWEDQLALLQIQV